MYGRLPEYTNGSTPRVNLLGSMSDSFCLSARGRTLDFGVSVYSQYSFNTTKYLKDVIRKREAICALRVLPKTQLLAQQLLMEQAERDLFMHQEKMIRQQIMHKRDEERLKKDEQALQRRYRERLDELKRKQAEELAMKKEMVCTFQKQLDVDVKEKLRLVCMLQPRMNVVAAVSAELKNDGGPLKLLTELVEEERRVTKALKAESRHGKLSVEMGAVPHWIRTCVAGSFNVGAILREVPYRAAVEEAIKVTNSTLRKVVVVRSLDDDSVVAWVHVRAGLDPVAVAMELVELPTPVELPEDMNGGVVWPKEDLADLSRKSKTTADAELLQLLQSIVGMSSTVLKCGGVITHEFTKKDVEAIGSLASA